MQQSNLLIVEDESLIERFAAEEYARDNEPGLFDTPPPVTEGTKS